MKAAWVPENVWRIEQREDDLHIALVRRFVRTEKVLKTASLAGFSALPELEKPSTVAKVLGKHSNPTFLSLGRDQGIVRQLRLPVDVQRDLKSTITLQIEAISAWPEQEVYWDYLAEKSADNPKMLAITIVIIPRAVLDPWLRFFESISFVLSGASLVGFDVNVIPPNLRQKSARLQLVASGVLAACIGLLAIGLVSRGPYQQHLYAADIQREISRLEPEVKSLVRQESEFNALTKRYQVVLGQLRSRDANLDALKTLAITLSPDTFLQNYRYQNETVTISGISSSALEVQSALEKTPVFRDVQFTAPITRDPSGKDRFTITMIIEARP
jgi:general secretion pathway protein L